MSCTVSYFESAVSAEAQSAAEAAGAISVETESGAEHAGAINHCDVSEEGNASVLLATDHDSQESSSWTSSERTRRAGILRSTEIGTTCCRMI